MIAGSSLAGATAGFSVQPRVEVTVKFKPGVASVGGSSILLHAGPAVVVEYGSAGGPNLPTLGVLTMPRPVATSSGATLSEIEAFLLSQPGVPASLAEEIRLLGDSETVHERVATRRAAPATRQPEASARVYRSEVSSTPRYSFGVSRARLTRSTKPAEGRPSQPDCASDGTRRATSL